MNRTIIFYILTCLTGFCNNVFSADPEHIELRADRAKIDELWDTLGDETPAGRARAGRLFRSGEAGRTPLHIACANRDYKEVKRLIDAGASVHAQEYGTNKTPLCSLVDKLQPGIDLGVVVKIIKLLASKGAKPDTVYIFSGLFLDCAITPLHKASTLGLTSIVEALIQIGADVNYQMRADIQADVIHQIRDRADMNIQETGSGNSALHCAQINIARSNLYSSDGVVEVLLDCGANPSLTNKCGTIPLYAKIFGIQKLPSSLFDREIPHINDFDRAALDDEKTSIGQLRTKLKKFNPREDERAVEAERAEYIRRQAQQAT